MAQTIEEQIRLYVGIASQMTQKADVEIERTLTQNGVIEERAYDLTVWIPIAFSRFWLKHSGVTFTDVYILVDSQENRGKRCKLENEPLFTIGYQMAERLSSEGVNQETLKNIATRSAEFRAINQALKAGEELGDLEMTELLINRFEPLATEPSKKDKKWYQFW